MTEHRFPARRRAAVASFALALACLAGTIAFAAPSKQDVEDAKAKLERIEGKLAEIQDQLASAQEAANAAAAAVEAAQGRLEETQADLQRTRAELAKVEARYERIRDRLNERAVDAYITGPVSGIDFVLGADSVAELTDRLVYADALAQADAELAAHVENLRTKLAALQHSLQRQQREEAIELAKQQEREDEVLDRLAEIQRLTARQERLVRDQRGLYRKLDREYERSLRGTGVVGGRSWDGGSLPEPYDHVLEVCPVDWPRGFGDGFGAPRYGGGYHLHRGVDIVAPMGTPIRAPFDGYAAKSSNSLGGTVVFVTGAYGRVYNAHLSAYSEHSSGPVSAGDVIGYVGETGDTDVPHDHFEFHPNVLPGGWPTSAYGYSVVDDAINPYPLLIQACG